MVQRKSECSSCKGLCTEQVPLLRSIPKEKRDELIQYAEEIRCDKGGYLFNEGEEVNSIWIIREGQVKLAKYDVDGREQVVGIFSNLDTIWVGMFLEKSQYPYSAVCTTNVVACAIRIQDFQSILKDTDVAMNIIAMLSQKLHDANERNMLLATKDPESKIAGMLLYHKERSTEPYIVLKLEDMAASLNLRPETVSRKLRDLENQQLIKRIGKGKLEILDYSGLKDIYDIRDGL